MSNLAMNSQEDRRTRHHCTPLRKKKRLVFFLRKLFPRAPEDAEPANEERSDEDKGDKDEGARGNPCKNPGLRADGSLMVL